MISSILPRPSRRPPPPPFPPSPSRTHEQRRVGFEITDKEKGFGEMTKNNLVQKHSEMVRTCSEFRENSWSKNIQIIIIASHPCQGIGHRQTSSTHPCLELSCLEPTTSSQHRSFLFPCIFSMSPVAYPCLSSPADSTEEPVV